jgi:hypothetical protein
VFVVDDDSHHEKLFQLLQYGARNECSDLLYANLSLATRDEYSNTTFSRSWDELDVPEYEYSLADVMAYGEFSGVVEGPEEGEEFAYVSYPPEGKPGENLLAQILMVREEDEEGREVLRIGLIEQYSHIEGGDYRYYWDAGR